MSEPFNKLDISTEDDTKITFNTEKGLEGHTVCVSIILHFDSPHNKLVSCSWDHSIRIWSSLTCECLATITQEENGGVSAAIKMTEDTFICSFNTFLRSFSISSHERLKEIKVEHPPFQLLKLTEDLLLCYGQYLHVISYSRSEIVKKYEMLNLWSMNNAFLLSRNYPNSFYVGTNAKHEPILLIDFEKDRIVKEFTGHEASYRTRAISLFKNSRNEEILIVCHTYRPKRFYSYLTSHPKFDTDKEIIQEEGGVGSYKYKCPQFGMIGCCCSLNNQFLFCGDFDGVISIYEYSEQERSVSLRRIAKEKIFTGYNTNSTVKFVKLVSSSKGQSIRLITIPGGYLHGEVYITRLSGLRLKDNKSAYEHSDSNERVHFLFHEPEKIFFDEKKKVLVGIKMENMKLSNISRIFLRV